MKTYISNTVEDTHNIAKEIVDSLNTNIIILNGELGAGKTEFTKGIAKALNIEKNITSPTFTILKSYISKNKNLHHFDCYRFVDKIDINLKSLGIEELVDDNNNLIVLEWANGSKFLKQYKPLLINIEIIEYEKRAITIN
jgi:tRNA threonylcarbamoyladenosine biosynthesis protein TsaE